MPLTFRTPQRAAAPNQISSLKGGTVFNFTSSTKGNNGACIRVADSKAGKGRFVNLESGKLLKSSAGDRATRVIGGTPLYVS